MAFRTDTIPRIIRELCHTNYPLYAERILIVRLAAADGVVIVPMVGGIFRLHPGQYSRVMLFHTLSSRAQYGAFVRALEDIRNAKGLALDDFREFLAEAPDRVVERFYAERMLIVRCAALGNVVIVPAVCGIFRSHPGQYSREMLCDTAAARRQYDSFLQALQDVATRPEVALDDFAQFLASAHDVVIERFYRFLNSRYSSTRLFYEVRRAVRREYQGRGFAATKHRIWALGRDITPPFLARLLDGTIQKLGRWLGM